MIVARSPWLFVGLVALEALFVLAQVTVLAFAFVLPSVMVLMAAHVAVPCADSVHRDSPPARSEAHRGLAASIARTYRSRRRHAGSGPVGWAGDEVGDDVVELRAGGGDAGVGGAVVQRERSVVAHHGAAWKHHVGNVSHPLVRRPRSEHPVRRSVDHLVRSFEVEQGEADSIDGAGRRWPARRGRSAAIRRGSRWVAGRSRSAPSPTRRPRGRSSPARGLATRRGRSCARARSRPSARNAPWPGGAGAPSRHRCGGEARPRSCLRGASPARAARPCGGRSWRGTPPVRAGRRRCT